MAKNIFSYFKQLGFDESILFQNIDSTGKENNYSLSHVNFDGISGLIYLLKQTKIEQFELDVSATRSKTKKVNFFGKAVLITKYLFKDVMPRPRNIHKAFKKQSIAETVRFYYFNRDELNYLTEEAQKNEVNLNTYLLKKINDLITPHTSQNNKTNLWMLPVSLYQTINWSTDWDSNSSFVEVEIERDQQFKDVHYTISKKISTQEFLAPKIIEGLLSLLPDFISIFLIKEHLKKSKRIGCFSNLGRWNVPGLDQNSKWGFSAPLSDNQPFSCSVVTINHQLCLSIRVYDCLGLDPMIWDEIPTSLLQGFVSSRLP